MKILYHHRTRAEDAQGVHIVELVKAFRELGHEVRIISLTETEEPLKRSSGTTWHDHFRQIPEWLYELIALLYNFWGFWLLARAIKTARPDLIYERYALNTFCGVWASRLFNIPLVLEVNAPLCHEKEQLGKLKFKSLARCLERWVCSNATLTVSVSNRIKEILLCEGVRATRMTVMPNGINPSAFHPAISDQSVRERHGLQGKIVIGFVGWFRPWHGLESLLEISRDASFRTGKSHLLLVGDGPAYFELYRYAEQHDLLSCVTFTGAIKRDDIPQYIAAMDIAVQPSAPEYACPMKIIEYMGMGKCIVAPDQPNIRELIDENVNGYLFKTGSKDNFRHILLRLIENSTLRSEAGRNAVKTIVDRELLWSSNAKRIIAFIGDTRLPSVQCPR
jgi:glycosyltransferase involved in cell wall biosynthesis